MESPALEPGFFVWNVKKEAERPVARTLENKKSTGPAGASIF
jgi:hypothetical protein